MNTFVAETIINEVENNGSIIKDSKGEITHFIITAENWRRIRTTIRNEVRE